MKTLRKKKRKKEKKKKQTKKKTKKKTFNDTNDKEEEPTFPRIKMAVVKDSTLCYVHIQNYPAPKKPGNMQSEAIERRICLLNFLHI